MDISQAFIQAEELNVEDQLLVIAPDCIPLPWAERVDTTNSKIQGIPEMVFKVVRPLYGLRDSPLRRLIQISTSIRRFGFKQHRPDICLFTRREGGNLLSLLLLYVDDLIFGYKNDAELRNFKNLLSEYRTGELDVLAVDKGITFLGLDIKLLPGGIFPWLKQVLLIR